MLSPPIENVSYEESAERVKVVMPAEQRRLYFAIYSILVVVWIAVSIWMVVHLFDLTFANLPSLIIIVWVLFLLFWAYVWYRLGRSIWRWWQYYAADDEILFVYEDVLIVRRPFSFLGVTDAYDMRHVSPFYYNKRYEAVAFDYGTRGGLFGRGLPKADARRLIRVLNRRIFPNALIEEEE